MIPGEELIRPSTPDDPPLFHYALRPGGFLFLGTSESVGDFTDLFSTQDIKAKLYQRKEGGRNRHDLTSRKEFLPPISDNRGTPRPPPKVPGGKAPLRELTERTLLQHYASASVLVNERGDILYLHGRSGMFLEPAVGEAAALVC